jgi:hypothetical protein
MSNYQNGQKEGRITTCDEKEKRKDKTGKKKEKLVNVRGTKR